MTELRPETIALHGGQTPDPTTNARAVPIYQTTSYVFDDTQHAADLFALKVPGNIYTRIMNPTWDVFEQRVAALEGGIAAVATASGQAAVTYSVLNLTRAGDNIISVSTLYGGTYNLFAHTLPQYGIEVRWFADPDDPDAVARLVDDKTRLVFAETIGNPKLNVVDIRAWADAAHAHGLPLIVDNTGADADPLPRLRPRRRRLGALRRRSTSAATARRSAASSSTPAASTGRRTPTASRPDEARPVLPRRRLGRRARAGGLHRPRPHGAAAQHRRGALAVQRLPVPAGPRDAAAAHGAPLAERARGRRAPRGAGRRHLGELPGARVEPVPRGRQPHPQRAASAASSRSASRAAARRAGSSSRASSCSATSRTSATPSRSRSTTRRRRTRS